MSITVLWWRTCTRSRSDSEEMKALVTRQRSWTAYLRGLVKWRHFLSVNFEKGVGVSPLRKTLTILVHVLTTIVGYSLPRWPLRTSNELQNESIHRNMLYCNNKATNLTKRRGTAKPFEIHIRRYNRIHTLKHISDGRRTAHYVFYRHAQAWSRTVTK